MLRRYRGRARERVRAGDDIRARGDLRLIADLERLLAADDLDGFNRLLIAERVRSDR